MKQSRCLSCQADVVFVPSAKTGKPMILDAKPAKGVVLNVPQSPIDDSTILVGLDHPDVVASVLDVYTDHHITCPNVDEWKGRHR